MLQFDEAISSTVRTNGKPPQPKVSPAHDMRNEFAEIFQPVLSVTR